MDWICYVNLQPAVLQRKLRHSMKTECSCRWSQALHSEQLGGLWHHRHCHQSNSLCTATNVPSARSKEMTSGTSDLFPSTKTHLFYFIVTLFFISHLFLLVRPGTEMFLFGPQINFCLPTQSRFKIANRPQVSVCGWPNTVTFQTRPMYSPMYF